MIHIRKNDVVTPLASVDSEAGISESWEFRMVKMSFWSWSSERIPPEFLIAMLRRASSDGGITFLVVDAVPGGDGGIKTDEEDARVV